MNVTHRCIQFIKRKVLIHLFTFSREKLVCDKDFWVDKPANICHYTCTVGRSRKPDYAESEAYIDSDSPPSKAFICYIIMIN